jgi:hypothetical protein
MSFPHGVLGTKESQIHAINAQLTRSTSLETDNELEEHLHPLVIISCKCKATNTVCPHYSEAFWQLITASD